MIADYFDPTSQSEICVFGEAEVFVALTSIQPSLPSKAIASSNLSSVIHSILSLIWPMCPLPEISLTRLPVEEPSSNGVASGQGGNGQY